ncbi:unnamed protein product [Thlaspi arvense]|uniref:CAF17 C-terminal domain-containing protein n=1 Tax=Thlaspi arvense TaxID=13288 RepID=A0AAU9SNP2_THLAR|nr:unnamed protein product [Thlaspi arvense]
MVCYILPFLQTLTFAWVNFFFSGFVAAKTPFPLTQRLITIRNAYNLYDQENQLPVLGYAEVNQKIAAGAEVVESGTGKKMGTVSTALGSRGMGVMRVEEAFKASTELTVKGSEDVKVQAIRPTWWPAEWSQQSQSETAAV